MDEDIEKSALAFRTIGEVAEAINVPQHVLRFWETKFSAIRPMKRGGNRRYYKPEDLELLKTINRLLYVEGYTIRGVQKLLREQGARQLVAHAEPPAAAPVGFADTPIMAAKPTKSALPHSSLKTAAPVMASPVASADKGRDMMDQASMLSALHKIRNTIQSALHAVEERL